MPCCRSSCSAHPPHPRQGALGLPLLALAYAALLLLHLPTALLCSITVIPAYALFATRSLPALLLRCAIGGALGIGIAAIYLLPAMALQPWISAHELWTSFYRASLVRDGARALGRSRHHAGHRLDRARRRPAGRGPVPRPVQLPDGEGRRDLGFWVALSLACLILIAGLLPWFWDLPLIGKVQFPWRLLMVVDFALLTALCLAPLAESAAVVFYVFAAAGVALMPGAVLMVTDAGERTAFTGTHRHAAPARRQGVPARRLQVRRFALRRSRAGPARDTPAIACTPTATTCSADGEHFGTMRVTVDSATPTNVVLRRFFFPAWQLDTGLPPGPSEPLRLVSFTAPAGHTAARLELAALPIERWGWAISGLSLPLLAALLVSARTSSR